MKERLLRRGKLWVSIGDSMPLLVSYVATAAGAHWIVRHGDSAMQASYLIASVFCPQIGLWSDWGRGTALLVRAGGDFDRYVRGIGPLVRRLPIVSVPTVAISTVFLVLIPLTGKLDARALLEVSLASGAAALMISTGNALRGVLLAGDRRSAYFWSQLWVAAGIPLFVAVVGDVPLGVLISGALYLVQQIVLTRGIWSPSHTRNLEGRWAFLRGDGLSWGIGAAQLITAASVAVEIPLVVALKPKDVLAYYAVTRLAQGLVSVAVRPVERGLPDVVRAISGNAQHGHEWASAVRYAHVIACGGGLLLLLTGKFVSEAWLGAPATPTWALLALVIPTSVLGVTYRAAASEAVAEQEGKRLVRMALLDLMVKVSTAVLLIPIAGAVGMAGSALLSTMAAFLASRRLRVFRSSLSASREET